VYLSDSPPNFLSNILHYLSPAVVLVMHRRVHINLATRSLFDASICDSLKLRKHLFIILCHMSLIPVMVQDKMRILERRPAFKTGIFYNTIVFLSVQHLTSLGIFKFGMCSTRIRPFYMLLTQAVYIFLAYAITAFICCRFEAMNTT
jgi:hypothetical protein